MCVYKTKSVVFLDWKNWEAIKLKFFIIWYARNRTVSSPTQLAVEKACVSRLGHFFNICLKILMQVKIFLLVVWPMFFDNDDHAIIVISPLTSLMDNQMSFLNKNGIKAGVLRGCDDVCCCWIWWKYIWKSLCFRGEEFKIFCKYYFSASNQKYVIGWL